MQFNNITAGTSSTHNSVESHLPSSNNTLFFAQLEAWRDETGTADSERSVVAQRIRQAFDNKSTHLDLRGRDISSLPEAIGSLSHLRQLDLSFTPLATLPQNLPNLLELTLNGCTSLASLPQTLPDSLRELSLNACKQLTTLPQNLPNSLRKLSMGGCTSLTTLPQNLPNSLQLLHLKGCKSLTSLPQTLPNSLQLLDLTDCTLLKELPQTLPNSLQLLSLNGCKSLTSLPQTLPSNTDIQGLLTAQLKIWEEEVGPVDTDRHVAATRIRQAFDNKSTHLSLAELKISSLPEAISSLSHLKQLDLSFTPLAALPQDLPTSLAKLNLEHCPSLKTLPPLPNSLELLILADCSSLVALPHSLPSSLAALSLENCTLLTTLPQTLPDSLLLLDLSHTGVTVLPQTLPLNIDILGFNPQQYILPHEKWYQRAGRPIEQITQLQQAWQSVPNTTIFTQLLTRLGEAALIGIVHPQQVIEVIDEVVINPSARTQIFEAVLGADDDCHDRPLLLFNNIQALAKISTLQRQKAGEGAIVNLAINILKQNLLDEVVPQVMAQQYQQLRRTANTTNTGPNNSEALEVQLGLRQLLAADLNLPFSVQGLYTHLAALNKDDLELARSYVKQALEDHTRLIDGLLAQPTWTHYITSQFGDEITEITDSFRPALQAVEKDQKDGQKEQTYLNRINDIQQARALAIQSFVKDKTNDILQKVEAAKADAKKV